MAQEKRPITTRVNGDIQTRFEEFRADRDLKVAEAGRHLIDRGLSAEGYDNRDEEPLAAVIGREFGKAALYLAAAALVLSLATDQAIIPGNYDATVGGLLLMAVSAAGFLVAHMADRNDWRPVRGGT